MKGVVYHVSTPRKKKKRKEWTNSLTHFKRTDRNGFLGETQTSKIIMRRWKGNNRFFFFHLKIDFFFQR